jgi:hypothetical protein
MLKKSLVLAAAGILCLGSLAIGAVGEGEGNEKTIRIERVVVDCDEGDDCAERRHHEIVVGHHGMIHHGMAHHRSKSFLGVQLTELTPELRAHFGVPEDSGVMVSKVVDGSAAAKAGLQAGDIISAVDGASVVGARSLSREIGGREPGETVQLQVWRDRRIEPVSATLEAPKRDGRIARVIKLDCEDGEDCDIETRFDCGGDEDECEVRVECNDGECSCTVNGEPADCEQIHAVRHHG